MGNKCEELESLRVCYLTCNNDGCNKGQAILNDSQFLLILLILKYFI